MFASSLPPAGNPTWSGYCTQGDSHSAFIVSVLSIIVSVEAMPQAGQRAPFRRDAGGQWRLEAADRGAVLGENSRRMRRELHEQGNLVNSCGQVKSGLSDRLCKGPDEGGVGSKIGDQGVNFAADDGHIVRAD